MRWTYLLALPLALAKSYTAQQQNIQVYLHPAPPSPHKSIPTLTSDQAKAVLNHHLGDPISDFDEIPNDESLWGHLIGLWAGKAESGIQGARIVIIDGGVSPQAVLPSTISKSPAFYLKDNDDATSLLLPYLQRAKSFFQEVLAALPDYVKDFVDGMEMAGTRASALLHQELSAFIAMSEKELIPFLSHMRKHAWEAMHITGLAEVQKDSQAWSDGTKNVKAGLQAMTQPDSPPLLVIMMPSQKHFHSRRDFAPLALNDSSSICYSSKSKCSKGTSCSDRGECSLLQKMGDNECWGCKCNTGYAGSECQKTDYSVPFVLLVFSTLMIIALIMGSISLLWTVGETKLPSTLTLAVGGSGKRD